ncbi:hypothetical protein AM571_PC00796 (plasmid) [Rhizobium etli 8C-3]|uniref:Uncharacterized protein n=1 Tax=Rhizobium etli 8C-3 TaxID=538025 RepID=A0A1L5PEH5_RHIET|nr:hypothetical protein AM571_PC00796 [Rhizobium etli 8C-3]
MPVGGRCAVASLPQIGAVTDLRAARYSQNDGVLMTIVAGTHPIGLGHYLLNENRLKPIFSRVA